MFTDQITLSLHAGRGGDGIVAWRREKYIPKGGPAGGDGGNGGSVIIRADSQLLSLEHFRHRKMLKAENGKPGGTSNLNGKKGEDLVIFVPCGTLIIDSLTKQVVKDLVKDREEYIACKGGRGGKGNTHFKSSTCRAPYICTPGTEGTSMEIALELKLIADIGLVGMPNAGKSTFMTKMTRARVKVAAYPFTTLCPNLGTIILDDLTKVFIADIPGIIAGASQNKGLGLSFLKHIERTSFLLFILDSTNPDPTEDFEALKKEIHTFNPSILEKPFIVALNKIDEESGKDNCIAFKEKYESCFPIFEISALHELHLDQLLDFIRFSFTEKTDHVKTASNNQDHSSYL